MKFSTQQLFYIIISAALVIANLLITNAVLPVWLKYEAISLLKVLSADSPAPSLFFPARLWSWLYESRGFDEFALRLPSGIVLLAGGLGFYFLSRKIFGTKLTLATLLVLGSSLLTIHSSKFAMADPFLLSFQLVSLPLILRYLKQDRALWQVGWWLCLLLGSLLDPLSMMLWGAGWWLFLRAFHPQGQQLRDWYFLILYIGLVSFGWMQGLLGRLPESFVLAHGQVSIWQFLGISLLGILPWLGFLPAALRDLVYKLKRGEELALVSAGWLLMALLSFSMILQFVLAFLIARQLLVCLQQRYPFGGLVKVFNLLVLVLVFCGAFAAMLGGFTNFGPDGFRAVMAVCALFWVGCFIGVLGLFSKNEWMLISGFGGAGLLSALAFWVYLSPFIQQNLSIGDQMSKKVEAVSSQLVVVDSVLWQRPDFQLYAWQRLGDCRFEKWSDDMLVRNDSAEKTFILNEEQWRALELGDQALENAETWACKRIGADSLQYWIYPLNRALIK